MLIQAIVAQPAVDAQADKRVQALTGAHVEARYTQYTGFHEQLRQQQCKFEEQLHTLSVDADASPFAAQLEWTQRHVADQVEASLTACRHKVNATFNRTGTDLAPRRPSRPRSLERKKSHSRNKGKSECGERKRKRGTLPPNAVAAFRQWILDHFTNPYPSEEDKRTLTKRFGLKPAQVNYWFINSRVRWWRPLVGKPIKHNHSNRTLCRSRHTLASRGCVQETETDRQG